MNAKFPFGLKDEMTMKAANHREIDIGEFESHSEIRIPYLL